MRKKQFAQGLGINGILRRHNFVLMAYAYITAVRDTSPDTTWMEAAEAFKKRYGIGEEIDTESLIRECARTNKQFIEFGF
jgi:hypothetical protein